MSEIKFDLGNVVATRQLHDYLSENEYFNTFVGYCLTLYVAGNWGVLPLEDWQQNDAAVVNGERILASYPIPADLREAVGGEDRIWIITEWDRSVTTILFPDEY